MEVDPVNAKRLVTNAVFIALMVLLKYVAIDIPTLSIKASLAYFPIIVCALLFGYADGMIVGGLGEFIFQFLRYGLGPTTALWLVAPIASGLIVGLYAQKKGFEPTMRQTAGIVLASCLAVTAINTVGLYFDAQILAYPTALTFVNIVLRFASSVVMTIVYTLMCPQAVELIRKSGVARN